MGSLLDYTTRSDPGLSRTPMPWMQKGMQGTVHMCQGGFFFLVVLRRVVALVRTVALFPPTYLVESLVRLVTSLLSIAVWLCGVDFPAVSQALLLLVLFPSPSSCACNRCALPAVPYRGWTQGVYYIDCSHFEVTKRHSASRQTIRALIVSNTSMARDVYDLCAAFDLP
jgi:hypothetical protein